MPRARIFGKDENGNEILLCLYDFETKEIMYRVSDDVIAEKRRINNERLSSAASDIAMQDPTSPLFDYVQ